MNNSNANIMLRIEVIALVLCSLFPLQPATIVAQASNSSFTVPFEANVEDSFLLTGYIHFDISSIRDGNGCLVYTIHHNFHNLITTDLNIYVSHVSTPQRENLNITVCDDEQCIISGILKGRMKIFGNKTPLYEPEYSLVFSWNRCTNELTIADRINLMKHSAYDASSPHSLTLFQNFPNPFNPSTKISYSLAEESSVRLSIHNSLGQQVAIIDEGQRIAGKHELEWNVSSSVSSGVYIMRLVVHDQDGKETILQRQMMLTK